MYKNVCIKMSTTPTNIETSPMNEDRIMSELENQTKKLSLETDGCIVYYDTEISKSYMRFYSSIPDYGDLQHLSRKEFYDKLENLRKKQRDICNNPPSEVNSKKKSVDWYNENHDNKSIKFSFKSFGNTQNESPCTDLKTTESDPYLYQVIKDDHPLPSRRSVHLENPKVIDCDETSPLPYFRPKSTASKSIGSCNDSAMDDLTPEDLKILNSEREFDPLNKNRSHSAINIKSNIGLKQAPITIPRPFQMTVRDEENEIINNILSKSCKPSKNEKSELFKANPIPLESQIEMYDEIVANNEIRSRQNKRNRVAALQSKMKPFSFTRREEEIQEIRNFLPRPSSSSFGYVVPRKVKKFKAKPVPSTLFSNYIYKKMYEDEFYRALQRRIRTEEMLKSSKLPPSMAKRDKVCNSFEKPIRICNQFEDALGLNDIIINGSEQSLLNKKVQEVDTNFINRTSHKTAKTKKPKEIKSSTASNYIFPIPNVTPKSINRTNLAAILRTQSARKRIEDEMTYKLESSRIRNEVRWRKRLIKQKSAWKMLTYNHEEDLAIRLQLRQERERVRSEKHRSKLRSMFGRVNLQPFLFERSQTQQKRQNYKTREELNTLLDCDEHSISPQNLSSETSKI